MKILNRGLVTVLLFAGIWCINASDQQQINLTNDESGKVLTVRKGRIFKLTLPEPVDGGYRFNKMQFDTTILRLQSHNEKGPPGNSPPGSPGKGFWQFIAVKKGTTALNVTVSRPWNPTDTVIVFKNLVIVK
jgi:predicted secreted protein